MHKTIKNIAVFCGTKVGSHSSFTTLAGEIGNKLAGRGITIICGGNKNGIVGALIDGAVGANGRIIGILPDELQNVEQLHPHLSELIKAPTITDSKQKLIEIADAFLILPGGFGTLDEMFETITLRVIGRHDKPIIIYNYNGFWDNLLMQINKMTEEGFIRKEGSNLLIVKEWQELEIILGRLNG